MSDTSNADNSPDAQDDAPPPSSWTPPRSAPTPLSSLAGYASDSGVWNRADGKTPDQPTTIAPPRRFPGVPDQAPPTVAPPQRDGDPKPPPIGLSPAHPMPFRPRPIQRYFPQLPNRPWHQWGEPREFAPEPTPWEVPGILSNVARYFTSQGSGYTAPTAAMLGAATQGHSKAYIEGQKAALGILEERMKVSADALDRKTYEEQKDYRDAFALGGGDVGTWSGDPNAKDTSELHNRLFEVATKYNDKPMLAALESGNLTRAENILKERDAQGTSLRESVTQRNKEEKTREEEAPYREGGTPPAATTSDGDTTTPAPSTDSGEAPSPGAAPPSSPAETAAPLPGAGPGDKAPVDPGYDVPDGDAQRQAQGRLQGVQVARAGASDAPEPGMARLAQQAPQSAFTPAPSQALQSAANDKDRITGQGFAAAPIEQWAQKLVNHTVTPTAKGLPGVPPKVFEYAQLRAGEIEKDLDRIQADPKITGAAVLPAIRKVDPEFADALKAYVGGQAPVPTTGKYLGLTNRVLGLGSKIDPGFNENTFKNRARVFADFSAGTDARTLTAVATAYSHLKALRDNLDKIPSLQASFLGQMRGVGKLVASPEERAMVGRLDNEVVTGASEYERALVGGKPTQSAREGSEKELNWRTMDADTLKANVDDKIARLQERMQHLREQFVGGSGAQPGAMLKMFDRFTKSGTDKPLEGDDERALASPGQTEMLRQLEGERRAPPPGAPQARTPEDNQALDWARSHPDDPRSKQILDHLGQ
ncbi:MAG TPA: hypothetical protein VGG68_11570 [Caulobacteraceae bacterium]|jgi:hypothetical protein